MQVETVPTGSLSLDIALGVGGVPKGRIIEIYGPESSGKTTVALHMVCLLYTSIPYKVPMPLPDMTDREPGKQWERLFGSFPE